MEPVVFPGIIVPFIVPVVDLMEALLVALPEIVPPPIVEVVGLLDPLLVAVLRIVVLVIAGVP